jgi:hypothetical protein
MSLRSHCYIHARSLRPLSRGDVHCIATHLANSGLFPGGLFAPEPISEGGILLGTNNGADYRTIRFTGARSLKWPIIWPDTSFASWEGNDEIVVEWGTFDPKPDVVLCCKASADAKEWTDAQLIALRDALLDSGAFAPRRYGRRIRIHRNQRELRI